MCKLYLTVFLTLMLLSETVFALGITPSRTIIDFEPGFRRTITFYAINNENKTMDIEVYKSGDLSDYITLSTTMISFSPSDSTKEFTVTINLPQSIEGAGRHDNRIGIREAAPPEGTTIGARIGIEAQLWVDVPYPGAYAEISLDAPSVELGETVPFTITIVSRGTEDMTASGKILVYRDYMQVADLNAGQVFVGARETKTLKSEWSTVEAGEGQYRAVAVVDYFGKTAQVEKTFNVGVFEVEIVNISYASVSRGEIARFDIAVKNMWNAPADVYIELEALKEGDSVSRTKSETSSLNPLETKTIRVYLDTEELSAGTYDIRAIVYYAGKTAIKELENGLEIIAFALNSLIIPLAAAVILLAAGFVLVYGKKKRLRK